MNQNEPAFASSSMYAYRDHKQKGLTKLEYFVAHNASATVKLIDGIDTKSILESINCIDESYVFEKHYPKYLAKIQILLAKELLKQLEDESNN